MTDNKHGYEDWIGRVEEIAEPIAAGHVDGLAATLDRDDPPAQAGDPLPPAWHWLFGPARQRQSLLGPDGHAARGGFLPPIDLPRRMWAGGRLTFERPLRVGETMTRRSEIKSISFKEGRTGRLAFVLVEHRVSGDGVPAIVEEHDIVYRAPPSAAEAGKPAPAAPENALWRRQIVPDPVMLFRYSALTFNGHRIHYDHPYTTEVEGYPGLIVHGPLIATFLLDLLRRERPDSPLVHFDYRAISPLYDTAPFHVCGRAEEDGRILLWAENPDGRLAMQGYATVGG